MAVRGREVARLEKRKWWHGCEPDKEIIQTAEINPRPYCNAITTVQKDNLILEVHKISAKTEKT